MFFRRLVVYTGPMFSGKTEAAQAELRKARIAARQVVYVRPAVANRDDSACVVSHAANTVDEIEPVLLGEGEEERLYEIGRGVDVVIVDEGQFLEPSAVGPIFRLFSEGKFVVYCGLDNDFLGKPFETTLQIMGIPEAEIHRLTAICSHCKNAYATRTHKYRDGGAAPADSPRFETGSTERYEALCLTCFLEAREL